MKSVKMAGIVMLGFLLLVPFSVSYAQGDLPTAMVCTTKYRDNHFELWFELKENLNSGSADFTNVSVTGPGISDSLTLEYYSDCDCWEEGDMLNVGSSVTFTDVYTFNYTVDGTEHTLQASPVAIFENFATLQFPADTATVNNPVTLEWLAATDAIKYEVDVEGPDDYEFCQSTTGTSLELPSLAEGTYQWMVYATDSESWNGETLTDAWSFTVSSSADLPTAIVGTTKYRDNHFNLWFELEENLNSGSADFSNVSVEGPAITGSLTLEYYSDCDCWEEVDSINVGSSVTLSDVYTFYYTVAGNAQTLTATAGAIFENFATLQSPADADTVNNPVTLQWEAATGATEYEVEVQGPDGFDFCRMTIGTTLQITETLSVGDYTWTVFAVGSNNAETVTDPWSFTVSAGGASTVPGDVNNSGTLDLADIIYGLQVLSGLRAQE